MTRWSTKDLTGMLVQNKKKLKLISGTWSNFQQSWTTEQRTQTCWPEYWKLDELEKVQATLPVGKWNAQWMQNQQSKKVQLLKREWWRIWKRLDTRLDHVIQSYDTAFLKKETADYSAITTWGVFYPNEDQALI